MSIVRVSVPVPVSGLGAPANVSSMVGSKSVQVGGSFDGYYDLLGSHDGSTYVPLTQFDTGRPEGWRVVLDGAVMWVRLRSASRNAAGVTCDVSGTSGVGQNGFGAVASLVAGFSGTTLAVDASSFCAPSGPETETCVFCRGAFQGPLVVEGSTDGTRWNPLGEFQVDRLPEGAPADVEFGPLVVAAQARYYRVAVLGVTTGAVVVTLGGRVPASGGSGGSESLLLSIGESAIADGEAGEVILTGFEREVDFSQISAATLVPAFAGVAKSNLDAVPTSMPVFRCYVGSTTPGDTTGGAVVASFDAGSGVESLREDVGAAFANPGVPCLVQVTCQVVEGSLYGYLRGVTLKLTAP
jgi:hypothetical protein